MAGAQKNWEQARVKLSAKQVEILNEFYSGNARPSHAERHMLALKLQIHDEKVKNWFQNKRAKIKKDMASNFHYVDMMYELNAPQRPNIYPSCSDLYRNKNL